jgi:exodeoxyribonuclease-3
VKIATYNINNVNKRFAPLAAWLKKEKPDIVGLQELKCEQAAFPEAAFAKLGYGAVWKGQRSWNGVAILARGAKPILVRDTLPGNGTDVQSRYIEAAVDGLLIGCAYMPNGNPQPGPKFDYKLAWFKRFNAHAARLLKAEVPAVLIGDFNVVPTEFDIYPDHSYGSDALLQPGPRAAFARLLGQGWMDAVRTLHPRAPAYSYWSYWRHRWPRNKGLRLDFVLLAPGLDRGLRHGGVATWVRGEPDASDHAPVWIEIERVRRRRAPITKRA